MVKAIIDLAFTSNAQIRTDDGFVENWTPTFDYKNNDRTREVLNAFRSWLSGRDAVVGIEFIEFSTRVAPFDEFAFWLKTIIQSWYSDRSVTIKYISPGMWQKQCAMIMGYPHEKDFMAHLTYKGESQEAGYYDYELDGFIWEVPKSFMNKGRRDAKVLPYLFCKRMGQELKIEDDETIAMLAVLDKCKDMAENHIEKAKEKSAHRAMSVEARSVNKANKIAAKYAEVLKYFDVVLTPKPSAITKSGELSVNAQKQKDKFNTLFYGRESK